MYLNYIENTLLGLHHLINYQVTSNEQSDSLSHVVICLNEIKMGVIAKAAVYPGANTLIMNMLSSFSDVDADNEENLVLIFRFIVFF